jgi:acetyl esterase/lipase
VPANADRRARRRVRIAATLVAVMLVVVTGLSGIAHAQTARYRDHVFANVVATHDVTYDGTDTLDIYAPSGDTDTARAAVAWFHPGGFTEGDKSKEADLANDLARRGYVVFVVDYTLNPKLQWFDMNGRVAAARVADLEAHAAIAWIKGNAPRYGVDASLVFAGGYSAGAIVAFDLDYGAAPASERVAGAFAIAGYTNETPRPDAAPMLDFHGSNDLLIPHALGEAACASAQHVGDLCTVDTFNGLGHEIGYTQRAKILDRASDFLASLIASS